MAESVKKTSGEELFEKLSHRDFSESPEDLYAGTLNFLHTQAMIGGELDAFYKLLEMAHAQGKKLSYEEPDEDILYDGLQIDAIILV